MPSVKTSTTRTARPRRAVKTSPRKSTKANPISMTQSVGSANVKAVLLQPRFKAAQTTSLPKRRMNQIAAIKLSNATQAKSSVATLRLNKNEIPSAFEAVTRNQSDTKQIHFTRAVMGNWKTTNDALEQSHEIMNWARGRDIKRRRMVCKAFRQNGEGPLLIHNIGGMDRKDARNLMKDFFDTGGSMDDVISWMAEVGHFLRTYDAPTGTDGVFGKIGKALSKAGKAAVDWAKGAIKTVGDAIKAAGKNLAKAVSKAASWTQAKVSDFVEGVIRAGKSVSAILSEAIKKGAAAFKKFAKAILDAGKRIRDVLAWASKQANKFIQSTVKALISLNKSVTSILKEVANLATSTIRATIRSLIKLGKKVTDIVKSLVGQTFSMVKKVVDGLLSAGKKVLNIVKDTITAARNALRTVLQSLISLGRKLGEILAQTFNRITFGSFKLVISTLKAIGNKIGDFINACVSRGMAVLRKVVQTLVSLGNKAADILSKAVRKTTQVLTEVMRGLKAAGRKAAEILSYVGKAVGASLRRLVTSFYQAFKDPVGVLKRFAKSTLNTVRMVLDGLLKAGYNFGKAVKAILTNVGKQFQKGFFKGLIALGKAPVEIMKEALKLTGALASLAIATLLDVLGGHRPMTAIEKREARKVFGSSIDFSRVKIADASLAADLVNIINNHKNPGGRPFTTMYVLNFASWRKVDLPTLIHELAHTWQGIVDGPIYMLQAIHAQMKGGKNAYTVTLADLAKHNGDFGKFNREQQARIVERYYEYKFGDLKTSGNASSWVTALEPYAKQVFKGTKSNVIKLRAKVIKPMKFTAPTHVRFAS